MIYSRLGQGALLRMLNHSTVDLQLDCIKRALESRQLKPASINVFSSVDSESPP